MEKDYITIVLNASSVLLLLITSKNAGTFKTNYPTKCSY